MAKKLLTPKDVRHALTACPMSKAAFSKMARVAADLEYHGNDPEMLGKVREFVGCQLLATRMPAAVVVSMASNNLKAYLDKRSVDENNN